MGKQQRVTAAEAVRMLEVYMSPTRLLENRQDSRALLKDYLNHGSAAVMWTCTGIHGARAECICSGRI